MELNQRPTDLSGATERLKISEDLRVYGEIILKLILKKSLGVDWRHLILNNILEDMF